MGDNDDSPVSTAVEEPVTTSASSDALEGTKTEKVAEEVLEKTGAAATAEETKTAGAENTAAAGEAAPTEEKESATGAEKANIETAEKVKKATSDSTPSGKKRPQYVYDPEKITLRFLFANRDGLSVMVRCDPADTVGEVKGALLSVWPEELPSCSGGDSLRLICMGKGILMPDSRTLQDFQVPVFRTHPTPVNVAVRPAKVAVESKKAFGSSGANSSRGSGSSNGVNQGCACVIL